MTRMTQGIVPDQVGRERKAQVPHAVRRAARGRIRTGELVQRAERDGLKLATDFASNSFTAITELTVPRLDVMARIVLKPPK